MTHRETLKIEKKWFARVAIIADYHYRMKTKKRKWTMRATAQKLSVSLGSVSESVRMNRYIYTTPSSVLEAIGKKKFLSAIRSTI